MVESFATRARVTIDDFDLALLRALAAEDAQTAMELADRLAARWPDSTTDNVRHRLEALAAITVVSSEGGEPPIWVGLERACPATAFVDFVEITNHCPSSCIMCRAAQGYMDRPRGFMPLDLFARIIAMIGPRPHLKPLSLHNAGEPLLHPDLVAMIALACEAGVPTEISTNPGLLNIETYDRLCGAGITRIVIAVDAIDAVTLTAIRGPGARPREAHTNLEAILAERAARGSATPALILQMVQMRANAHQQRTFLDRFGELAAPGVSAFLKPLEAPAQSPLFMEGASPPQFFCVAPWQSLGVFWDGRVVPCCYDLNASLCVGDVHHQSLAEIWQGDALAALRERIKTDQCSPAELCYICHHRPDRYQRPDLLVVPELPDDWH